MSASPNRLLGAIFGVVYLAIGLLGFTVSGGVGDSPTAGALLLGTFEVNGLQNAAHLLLGAALLIAALSSVAAARVVNTAVGAVLLLLGIAGLFLVGTTLNVLALNAADNVLHFAGAAVLLAVGLGAERRSPATGS